MYAAVIQQPCVDVLFNSKSYHSSDEVVVGNDNARKGAKPQSSSDLGDDDGKQKSNVILESPMSTASVAHLTFVVITSTVFFASTF